MLKPRQPSDPGGSDAPRRWPDPVRFEATPGVVTYTYEFREAPSHFCFVHDRTKGLFVLAKPDGTTEQFRDNPVAYLVVEPDPQTGELRPASKYGRPVYLYLCREQREG